MVVKKPILVSLRMPAVFFLVVNRVPGRWGAGPDQLSSLSSKHTMDTGNACRAALRVDPGWERGDKGKVEPCQGSFSELHFLCVFVEHLTFPLYFNPF